MTKWSWGGISVTVLSLFIAACAGPPDDPAPEDEAASQELPAPEGESAHDAFLANLAHHCGEAFPGEALQFPDDDPDFATDPPVVMHIRECSPDEVRIPVVVGDNRSRTWIFTRTGEGVDLRHDHRSEDGTPEANTFYGSFVAHPPVASEPPTPNRHEFKTEAQGGSVAGWIVEIVPGERYAYGTRRDGEWGYRFEFDLSDPVPPPPDPWGHPPVGEVASVSETQEGFLENLARHCGQAFHGQITQRPETDQLFRGDEVLTVHFRHCEENRLELPFHVEDNRSRTWILQRTTAGLDLRHDHRYPDGRPEPGGSTWYGAPTREPGTVERQEFLREAQDGVVTGWAIEIVPEERYTYGTIRNGEWNYRLDFDLSEPVEVPPAPWGH